MLKTNFFYLFFIILALAFTSCGSGTEEKMVPKYWESPAELDFDAIKKRGFIRAVVDNSSTSYYIYRGRTMGYEFELLRNLANQLGVNLRLIVRYDLEDAFKLLNRGKADIVAINFEVTEERKKLAAFTDPVNMMKTVVVQRKDNSHVDSLTQLKNKKVYIKRGTIYKQRLMDLNDSLRLSLTIEEKNTSLEDLINQVIQEEIDYTVVDDDIALVNATYNDLLDVSLRVSQPNPVSWAIRKNAPQLLGEINYGSNRLTRQDIRLFCITNTF